MSKECKVLRDGIRQRDGEGGWRNLRVGQVVDLPDGVAIDFASADPPMVEVLGLASVMVPKEEKKKPFKFKKKKVDDEEKAAADEVAREKDLEANVPLEDVKHEEEAE